MNKLAKNKEFLEKALSKMPQDVDTIKIETFLDYLKG